MKFSIQPILNLEELEQSKEVSRKELTDYKKQEIGFIQFLKLKLPQIEIREVSESFPENIPPDRFVLWFVGSYSDDRIIELALSLDEKTKYQTLLFRYAGDDPRGLLETTHFAGLVTEATADYWKADLPEAAFKMGVGHGLYGLRSAFDEKEFISLFKSMFSSKSYVIFYNYVDYQLDRILLKYLTTLSEVKEAN